MSDREKVVKVLEEISDYFFSVYHHSRDREEINKAKDRCDAAEDAIAMLKEQEAVKPKKIKGYNPPMYTLYEYECEKCESPMMNQQPFCMGCGRAVKWNG